ncbi:uncharacterized protein LOC129225836 [Uloborus diversus]|uniref:uncharacterized protein LOC129225836 n=1 Tax=Uloborus diversus TaxID=327109 RepID=UPI00240A38B8|nr:uncharacterized protein LOC129225836 [Uloborus diversus]
MHPSEKEVRFAWKLVAQFVSWDFCRYVCQQSNNDEPETDVLTFLRNMFVERTEKLISEVTKHEIIAKFILEVKAIRSLSRLPCVVALSKTVQIICPELREDVVKLLRHLESLLNILDSSQECLNSELIELRMVDAVSVFTKEANKLLPPPDLLQIIQPWANKTKPKRMYNKPLFEKVLMCLQKETITALEARLITVAACEDSVLQKIVLQAESETELETDSETFSFVSSQATSQEPLGSNYVSPKKPPRKTLSNQTSFSVVDSELDVSVAPESSPSQDLGHKMHTSPFKISCNNSLHFTQDSEEYCVRPAPVSKYLETDVEEPQIQIAQSSDMDNDDSDDLIPARTWKAHEIHTVVPFEQETSDCDDSNFVFLTPTIYKENYVPPQACQNKKLVWSASQQSDSSFSVASLSVDNKKEDPTWRTSQKISISKKGPITRNFKKKSTKTVKNTPKTPQCPRTIWSESQQSDVPSDSSSVSVENEEEDPAFIHWNKRTRSAEKKSKMAKPKKLQKKKVTSITCDTKKKKILFHGINNYFDPVGAAKSSKSLRVQHSEEMDIIPEMAEEVEVRTHASPPRKICVPEIVHKRKIVSPSVKMKKCRYCSRTYKTQLNLKRHMFLKHPLGDDDDD